MLFLPDILDKTAGTPGHGKNRARAPCSFFWISNSVENGTKSIWMFLSETNRLQSLNDTVRHTSATGKSSCRK
jgi:hypothetical protein